jgi:hypothetical protein
MSRLTLWLVVGLLFATTHPARAQLAEVEFAEKLVRVHYFEGIPYAEARELTSASVERLIEMLRDPAETEHRENIIMALGVSGAPQAYPALVEFWEEEIEGEVAAIEYQARRALPLAMGHLAGTDPRALQFILEAARREEPEPAQRWSYLYLRDQRLAGILRRAAITGVAMSGRPEAIATLHNLGERARLRPDTTHELRTHIREAQRLCDRVAREGRDRVFDAGGTR